jgi:hypothetical protein
VECGVFKGGAAFCRLILVGKGRPQRLDGVTSFANPGQHLDLVVMSMNQGKAAVAFASPDLKFGAVTVRLNQLLFAWASAKTGQEVAVTDPGQIEQAWQPLQCDHFKTALTFSGLFGNPDHPVCDLSGPDRSKTLDALEHGDNVALAIDSLVGQALFDLDGASFRRSERVFLRESAGRLPR